MSIPFINVDETSSSTMRYLQLAAFACAFASTLAMIRWTWSVNGGVNWEDLVWNLQYVQYVGVMFRGLYLSSILVIYPSITCIILGLAAIIKSKGKFHIHGWHSGFGSLALFFYFYQFLRLGDVGKKVAGMISECASDVFMKFHKEVGHMTWALAMITVVTGVVKEIPQQTGYEGWSLLVFLLIFIILLSILMTRILTIPIIEINSGESSILSTNTDGRFYTTVGKQEENIDEVNTNL